MCSNCPHGIAINLLDFIRVNCSIDLLWLAKCQNITENISTNMVELLTIYLIKKFIYNEFVHGYKLVIMSGG
jgi:hypothetical protein